MVEDIDRACKHVFSTDFLRYAWYSSDTLDNELKNIVVGGHTYIAKKHTANLVSEAMYPRFYNWDDENGIAHYSANKDDYIELKSNTPVLITNTMHWYNPSSNNTIIGSILGDESDRSWLASTFTGATSEFNYVFYGIRILYSTDVHHHDLVLSNGENVGSSYGLRPVVSISAKLIDVGDTSTDGTSALKAWNIK